MAITCEKTALIGDVQEPLCGVCGTTDCNCATSASEVLNAGGCAVPSNSPLQFRQPVGACEPDEETAGWSFHEKIANGISWPLVNSSVTITVEASARYAVGQGAYIIGYGWLMVGAIASPTQITLTNIALRANPDPGTIVPTPMEIAPGIMPKPDAEWTDFEEEADAAIEAEVTEQVNAKIDPAPLFPTSTVKKYNSGHVALIQHGQTGDESKSEVGYQEISSTGESPLAVISAGGCDGEEVRFDKLAPNESLTGDMMILERKSECDTDPPIPRKADFEETLTDSTPDETWSPIGFRTRNVACDAGTLIEKIWVKLKKLVYHNNLMNSPVLNDNTLRVIVSNYDGTKHKICPLTLGENEALVGDGAGGVKVQNVLDVVPPSVVAADSGEPEVLKSGSTIDNGIIIPNGSGLPAPDCATHAILALRLGSASNSEVTMNIGGYQRLKAGSETANPRLSDTVVWVPLGAPTASLAYSIASVGPGSGPSEWSIALIGYQCNRP